MCHLFPNCFHVLCATRGANLLKKLQWGLLSRGFESHHPDQSYLFCSMDFGASRRRHRMLSLNDGSRVISRWSENTKVTSDHAIGVTRPGVHCAWPTRSSMTALLRSTLASPGARSTTASSPDGLTRTTEGVATASPEKRCSVVPGGGAAGTSSAA